MYTGSNCNRKPKLSDILTEPLNPRGLVRVEGIHRRIHVIMT